MAVLTKERIVSLIKSNQLKIHPFSLSQIGPASIDLHLSNVFRIFNKINDIFEVKEDSDYHKITKIVKVKRDESILLSPGEFVQGVTIEKISIPNNISGRIEGRSRFARVGLVVHLSSAFVNPGFNGKLVLEIANFSPVPLKIKPNLKICQLVLETVEGSAKYKGKFYGQSLP